MRWIYALLLVAGCARAADLPFEDAPTIQQTTPDTSATGQELALPISVTFVGSIDSSTVTDQSFLLSDAFGPVTGIVAFDAPANTATFTPDARLRLLTRYTATLTTSITNVNGRALEQDHVWSFDTRDGAWAAPDILSSFTAAEQPGVVVGRNQATLVWIDAGVMFESRQDRTMLGSTWSNPSIVDGNVVVGDVGTNTTGDAVIVWTGNVAGEIRSRRYNADGTFTSAVDVAPANGIVPRVAVNNAGEALAAWQSFDGMDREIEWALSDPAGIWTTPVEFNNDSGDGDDVDVAVNPNGEFHATFTEYSSAVRRDVHSARFATPLSLLSVTSDMFADVREIHLASGGGEMITSWVEEQSDLNGYVRYAVATPAADGWVVEPDSLNENPSDGDARQLRSAVDGAGNLFFLWQEQDSLQVSGFRLYARRYDQSSDILGDPVRIDEDPDSIFNHELAVDQTGNATVTWTQMVGGVPSVFARRYNSLSATWEQAERLDSAAVQAAGNLSLTLFAPEGTGAVAWIADSSTPFPVVSLFN